MFEPVWFGNYIITRWEAFLLVGGAVVVIAVVALGAVLGVAWMWLKLYQLTKRM